MPGRAGVAGDLPATTAGASSAVDSGHQAGAAFATVAAVTAVTDQLGVAALAAVAREGEVPGALVIERNVLEWRCDPTSDARLPQAVDDDVEWVILCSEGYTSSLAAASLLDLGLHRATDVVGGYRALAAGGVLAELGGAVGG